jgi:hypothetical protein
MRLKNKRTVSNTGCDIYIRLEKINKDGKWVPIDHYQIREDWDDQKNICKTFPFFPVSIYDGRDYELFGLLAGVRSTYPEPIAEPRGIPESANRYIKDEFAANKYLHTPSWLTLGELRKTWYKHSQDEPLDEDGFHNVYIRLLEGIIKPIERRIEEVEFLFCETDVELEEKCRNYWDSVRMVFWFDS